MEVRGEGDYNYTYRYTTRTTSALRWAAMRAILISVSVGSDGQSHKTVSTNHNLFEEKEQPKRCRTVVLPLTNLTPYHWAKPAHKAKSDDDELMLNVLRCHETY